tara:strand:- start:40 stop:345 length:306 start_codon:yes stop_codon:yes gene_type:complete
VVTVHLIEGVGVLQEGFRRHLLLEEPAEHAHAHLLLRGGDAARACLERAQQLEVAPCEGHGAARGAVVGARREAGVVAAQPCRLEQPEVRELLGVRVKVEW